MRKKINVIVGLAATAAIVIGGIVVTTESATASPAATATASSVTSPRYGGEELFRAAVFGEGEAAAKLVGLTTPVAITPEVDQEIGRIVAKINSDDPTYFDRFAALAQSGNALKVDDAFRQTSKILDSALLELGYADKVNTAATTPQCIQFVLFAVAALVYAGAAILQVAAVAVSFWYAGPKAAGDTSTLTREKWIAAVTSALA